MVRQVSFLDSSLKINGILEIITLVSDEPVYFHDLFKKSKIQYKKSFLNYLKFCFEKGFIKKTPKLIFTHNKGTIREYDQYQNVVYYSITAKGKQLLVWLK